MASDEGFREIQLNGKQLVFLFMATTIVGVVIFLCGVMVGRGVHNATASAATEAVAAPAPAGDLAAVPDAQAPARSAAPPVTAAPPPAPPEDVPAGPRPGTSKAAGAQIAATPPAASVTAPAASPATVPPANVASEPAGNGFVVQIAALNEKREAEAVARHLLEKGYAAYLVPPPASGGMFRVRIGKFKERREADAVVRRLKKEEQLEPWIIPPAR